MPTIMPKTISSTFSPCATLNTRHINTDNEGIITNIKYLIIFIAIILFLPQVFICNYNYITIKCEKQYII